MPLRLYRDGSTLKSRCLFSVEPNALASDSPLVCILLISKLFYSIRKWTYGEKCIGDNDVGDFQQILLVAFDDSDIQLHKRHAAQRNGGARVVGSCHFLTIINNVE